MKLFFKTVNVLIILIGSYFISYYGTTYVNNRRYTGDEQIEYIVSTQFERYNPEYTVVDEFVSGVEIRLYQGILDNKTGYVMVVKDIEENYLYSFLVNKRGDIYAKNQIHVDGTTYVPLHRQAYSYHTFIVLYTYHDDQLQYYFPQHTGLFSPIDEIHANSQTPGRFTTLITPSNDVFLNYFAIVGTLVLGLDYIYLFNNKIKSHYRRKANIADYRSREKEKTQV